MTSTELRQSFLDFFAERGHTVVPSASLLPSSPNLLFTNAGMNQFVPYFLGETKAPFARAADTQKCIRAGGKHNDLEDVGFDTYHHTFFEMLGNWSFGDYFKKESLTWGWELLTKVWGIPPARLYATVYQPASGDPADFDHEAHAIWAGIFESEGLDPTVHILTGNKKDNFWMMGDTGPCGPCSEIHFDLTPEGNAGGRLVNQDSPRCIEIWNHVFIQFNAAADGSFSPLAQRHVDTGMGFDRVAGIMAATRHFTDFSAEPSNYASDHFTPILARIEELSGLTYRGTVPRTRNNLSDQEKTDVAFRVLADHARTICCAIADSILPGNEGRNYVIRRILRRGILYGRKMDLETGFFESLVDPVVATLGDVFPEIRQQETVIRRVIRNEEESFGRTLDRGLQIFERGLAELGTTTTIPGALAFELYDTFGFPLDMTALLALERGLSVDSDGFHAAMELQRSRGRAAQKKEVIEVSKEDAAESTPTPFVGYEIHPAASFDAEVIDVVRSADSTYLVFDQTPFYAEMGGQIGDRGVVRAGTRTIQISDTIKDRGGRFLHRVANLAGSGSATLPTGSELVPPESVEQLKGKRVEVGVNLEDRREIERHHTATHLLHHALRRVVGKHVRQAGSLVATDHLRFDFSHFEPVSPAQLAEIESIINRRVLENSPVATSEVAFNEKPDDVIAFFGEKYGDRVRVVDIGGYSKELCGGTHVRATGELGLVKLLGESGIAAGIRRIEAVSGKAALRLVEENQRHLAELAAKLGAPIGDLDRKLEQLLEQRAEAEKTLRTLNQKATAGKAGELADRAQVKGDLRWVSAVTEADDPNSLRSLGAEILGRLGEGVVVLGASIAGKATVVAFASPKAVQAGHQAGKIISRLAQDLDGRGGGKPDFAMGGGKDASRLPEVMKSFSI
ncbi:MAG: alanine--tRNA ligase [Opitutaceae bacterium]